MTLPARVLVEALDGVSLPLALKETYCVSFEQHFKVARRLVKQGVTYVSYRISLATWRRCQASPGLEAGPPQPKKSTYTEA